MTATTAPEAKVIPTPYGWLAVTADGTYPRIGVMGDTEREARDHYAASRAEWLALREQPAPAAAEDDEAYRA